MKAAWAKKTPEERATPQEVKDKISKSTTGVPKSPESIEKGRKARTGKKRTPEQRARMRAAQRARTDIPWNKGKKMSEEYKKNVSIGTKAGMKRKKERDAAEANKKKK